MAQLAIPDIEQEVRDALAEAINLGIDEVVQKAVSQQRWYRKYANTISTAVGLSSTVAMTVLSMGLDLPQGVSVALVVVGSLATILGVSQTKNGVQPHTAVQLQEAARR